MWRSARWAVNRSRRATWAKGKPLVIAPGFHAFSRSFSLGVRRELPCVFCSWCCAGVCRTCRNQRLSKVCSLRVRQHVEWRCPSPVVTTPRALDKAPRCREAPSRALLPEGRRAAKPTAPTAGLLPLLLVRFSGDGGTRRAILGGTPGAALPAARSARLFGLWGAACLAVPCRLGRFPFRAALNRAGGATARPPSPPPPSASRLPAGPPSGFLLTVSLFPVRKNRSGFPGARAHGPPPSAGCRKGDWRPALEVPCGCRCAGGNATPTAQRGSHGSPHLPPVHAAQRLVAGRLYRAAAEPAFAHVSTCARVARVSYTVKPPVPSYRALARSRG